ncbi:MAG: sarcosine oxidase subunit gamma [Stutzerimonas stutzeri]|nr:MAG: sarcosine oxidase subunit gamma [Stutzerimonas stutzeri]
MADSLTVSQRHGLGLAMLAARKGVTAEALSAGLGFLPPRHADAVMAGSTTMLGYGPGSWLIVREGAADSIAPDMREALGCLASVSDQSGSYAVFRIGGLDARRLLQRGASIDLHPRSFAAGSVATTLIAHIGTIIHQRDDAPTYDVLVFRSFAGSFGRWLDDTAASL